MSEMLLVKLDGKRVYLDDEFTVEQYKHLIGVKERLLEIHGEIVSVMRQTFEVFEIHVCIIYLRVLYMMNTMKTLTC